MATTTNYGWTTPDDTALVKDGAAAIRSLGTAIDTSMNTALGTKKAGLVLLNTTSFSAVASQSINDVFSSTYDNYVIKIYTSTASTTTSLNMRLRVSGADNSTSAYASSLRFQDSANNNLFDLSAVSQSTWRLSGNIYSGYPSYTEVLISNPFGTVATNIINNCVVNRNNLTGAMENYFGASSFGATTSFTGFTIYTGTGNMTGSVSTFGVNK